MFSARYWLFMAPMLTGIMIDSVKVSTFGLPLGTVIVLLLVFAGWAIFGAILDQFWNRK